MAIRSFLFFIVSLLYSFIIYIFFFLYPWKDINNVCIIYKIETPTRFVNFISLTLKHTPIYTLYMTILLPTTYLISFANLFKLLQFVSKTENFVAFFFLFALNFHFSSLNNMNHRIYNSRDCLVCLFVENIVVLHFIIIVYIFIIFFVCNSK